MPTILHLETSGKSCSVSWTHDGVCVADESILSEHFIHAEQLHPLIEQLRKQANIEWNALDAVAVSKGPGSYTGLRIGVSAAKGLCYATGAKLIALDTTAILANEINRTISDYDLILPMIDAGRMEVYCATFNAHGERIKSDEACIIDDAFFLAFEGKRIVLTGDGASKCAQWASTTISIHPNYPTATMMHSLASTAFHSNAFVDVAYFEPFYLKEYMPGISKRSVL
jgi:tRNA threonylcarbamoyladenosine biosynthesis protein TsaB